jgi:hypothetical protein
MKKRQLKKEVKKYIRQRMLTLKFKQELKRTPIALLDPRKEIDFLPVPRLSISYAEFIKEMESKFIIFMGCQ